MQQVEVRRRFSYPAQKVWDLTGNFGGLKDWLPGVVDCQVGGAGACDQGGNAIRSVTLMDGSVTRESLESLNEDAMSYRYAIREAKGFDKDSHYVGQFRVEACGDDACEIIWQAEYSVPASLPPEKLQKFNDKVQNMYGFFLLHLESVLS